MSRLFPAALVAGLVLALPGPSASAVPVNQTTVMPRTGTFTLTGHGYGHGHGMSQYGAEGAARQGRTWQEIVRFYYPGTTVATRKPMVKVLISGDTTRDVVVSPRTGLKVRDSGTGETWPLPANGAERWRLNVVDGRNVVGYRINGRWRMWRRLVGDGWLNAGGQPITLHYGGTSRRYRGHLVAARPGPRTGDRDTVNVVWLDDYVRGVIPQEMPVSWSAHALRAQAVAARTYAAYEQQHPRARHYQICDTTSCQVYGGHSAEDPRSNDAVATTAGRILVHDGEPAFTQFSSSSGGWTAANRFSYLPAQQDPYDGWPGNPVHTWKRTFDVARVERTWPAVGDLRAIRVVDRDGNGQWKGRVNRLVLVGSKNNVTVSGAAFRSRLGLRSTWFAVTGTQAR
jgi:stage II sporulation protein D